MSKLLHSRLFVLGLGCLALGLWSPVDPRWAWIPLYVAAYLYFALTYESLLVWKPYESAVDFDIKRLNGIYRIRRIGWLRLLPTHKITIRNTFMYSSYCEHFVIEKGEGCVKFIYGNYTLRIKLNVSYHLTSTDDLDCKETYYGWLYMGQYEVGRFIMTKEDE